MIEIGINKISKSFGFGKLFENISFDIKSNERVCLIGKNGCGKTTILNMIAGIENVDNGTISIRNNSKLGYLKQENEYYNDNLLVKDIVFSNVKNIIDMKNKMNLLEKKLSNCYDEKIFNKYYKIQEQYISSGGYELDSKILKIFKDFNINRNLLDKRFNDLSGGEKTIIKFVSILVGGVDILLLDEPTNHLDIDKLNLLEKFLNNYKGTVLFVSHDRYFINRVANKIVLLENNKVNTYYGNYDYYKIEYKNKLLVEFKDYKNQQKEIKAMKEKIKQLEDFGKKASVAGGEIFFKRANSIKKRIDKIKLLDKPFQDKKINLFFDNDKRSGNDVLSGEHINIKYGDNIILNDAKCEIFYKDRVCLIGSNGCGKTSFIKYILDSNNIRIGSNVKIGYISQESNIVDNTILLSEAKKYFKDEEYKLRSALFKFGFEKDNIYKRLNILSGGELIRFKLFCLMQERVNFLILDEPTNHIDINTREILEDALENFDGTILFVSHDRYFMNKIATKYLKFENKQLVSIVKE